MHAERPVEVHIAGSRHAVGYEPAESRTSLFGGNSNWRGPIWFPINYLLVESLQKYHHFLGDDWQVAFPAGSGETRNLWDVAGELSRRLISIFLPDADGRRPVDAGREMFTSPAWRDHVTFPEYFHGDTGAGLGASHQTGWTALVAKLVAQSGR